MKTIQISGADYRIGTFTLEFPYKLKDIVEEIKKVDEFNYCQKLYELDFKLIDASNWEFNVPLLVLLDEFHNEMDTCGLIEKIVKEILDSVYPKLYKNQERNRTLTKSVNKHLL